MSPTRYDRIGYFKRKRMHKLALVYDEGQTVYNVRYIFEAKNYQWAQKTKYLQKLKAQASEQLYGPIHSLLYTITTEAKHRQQKRPGLEAASYTS